MKINLHDEEVYVDITYIVSVGLDYWDEHYVVQIVTTNGMGTTFRSKDKEKALKVLREIGDALEDKKPKKTYLDGFKDGTEYALKLIGVNSEV